MGPGWGGVRWGADLLVLSEAQDGLEHAAVEDLLEKLVRERALGAECALLERHVLLGLGVEGRVFDEAVDEDLASEWQASKRASR